MVGGVERELTIEIRPASMEAAGITVGELVGALQAQKVAVEVHLYPNGGHGYGMRPDKTKQVTSWPERCADWMRNRNTIR